MCQKQLKTTSILIYIICKVSYFSYNIKTVFKRTLNIENYLQLVSLPHYVCLLGKYKFHVILFSRYGHFRLCSQIVCQLHERVSSENLHFWLITLEEMSSGEAKLKESGGLLERIGEAVTHYCKALAAIKVNNLYNNRFQGVHLLYLGIPCSNTFIYVQFMLYIYWLKTG